MFSNYKIILKTQEYFALLVMRYTVISAKEAELERRIVRQDGAANDDFGGELLWLC